MGLDTRVTARCAAAVEDQFVTLHFEALRAQGLDSIRAPMDIEGLIAGATQEVVVMRAGGEFVPHSSTRQRDLDQPSVFSEGLQVPIDGRHAEGGHDRLPPRQHLVGRERTIRGPEHAADRAALAGVSSRCSGRHRRQASRPDGSSVAHVSQAPAWQTRALRRRAPATIRLPVAEVAGSGAGASQPAREAAQRLEPAANPSRTPAFRRAGPRARIIAPRSTVATHSIRSALSERARAGAARTRNGVMAQCTPHQAAAHAASREVRARWAVEGAGIGKLLTLRRDGAQGAGNRRDGARRRRRARNDNGISSWAPRAAS